MNYIELNKTNISNVPFDEARFVFFAESNAMGRPGEVEILLRNLDIYTFNYVYEDISFLDFKGYFPAIVDCEYGVSGFERMEMNGWKYVSLSSGNHLLVHEEISEAFALKYFVTDPPVYIYQNWKRWAKEVM